MSLTVRASSLSEYMNCPARWYAKHVDGITMPTSAAAYIGTSIHAGAAKFDELCKEIDVFSEDSKKAVDDAKAQGYYAMQVSLLNAKAFDVEFPGGSDFDSPEDAIDTCNDVLTRYFDSIAFRYNFLEVEHTFQPLYFKDLDITLTGTTDRIFTTPDGEFGIADIKTGKRIAGPKGVDKAKYLPQLAAYMLLGQNEYKKTFGAAEIIGLNVKKSTRAGSTVYAVTQTSYDSRSTKLLIGDTESGQAGLLEVIAHTVKSGDIFGNCQSYLCSEDYCPIYNKCCWH